MKILRLILLLAAAAFASINPSAQSVEWNGTYGYHIVTLPRGISNLNPYAFCDNDPLNKYDPDGQFPRGPGWGTFGPFGEPTPPPPPWWPGPQPIDPSFFPPDPWAPLPPRGEPMGPCLPNFLNRIPFWGADWKGNYKSGWNDKPNSGEKGSLTPQEEFLLRANGGSGYGPPTLGGPRWPGPPGLSPRP
ncbi:MAG TPA: hypothetical protein PLX89_07720 [Verrucomicrobiota bacterium]|nr:hypothetical protein [Verrucomicrobiota bacterium]